MKITWNKNPLKTTVELDEHEKKELWYKLKVRELEELVWDAHFTLTHVAWHNAQSSKQQTFEEANNEAASTLDPEVWEKKNDAGRTAIDERVDELHAHLLEELMDRHVGDCTCVACSCSKCIAEDLLGINTIKGLRKHSSYKIGSAFGRDNEKTIDEAIESLANYNPEPPSDTATWNKIGGWEKYLPRWQEEAKDAHAWLIAYRDEHFPT